MQHQREKRLKPVASQTEMIECLSARQCGSPIVGPLLPP
jgi:hypothetical protein